MANKVHDTLGVPVTYVVSNPSSYAYLDATRPPPMVPISVPWATPATAPPMIGGRMACQGRTGYTAKIPDDQLKKQLVARPVEYLLGEIDIPAGRFRFVVSRDSPRSHPSGARSGFREIRESKIRRHSKSHGSPLMRSQRQVHVHLRSRASHNFPEAIESKIGRPYSPARQSLRENIPSPYGRNGAATVIKAGVVCAASPPRTGSLRNG